MNVCHVFFPLVFAIPSAHIPLKSLIYFLPVSTLQTPDVENQLRQLKLYTGNNKPLTQAHSPELDFLQLCLKSPLSNSLLSVCQALQQKAVHQHTYTHKQLKVGDECRVRGHEGEKRNDGERGKSPEYYNNITNSYYNQSYCILLFKCYYCIQHTIV